MAAEFTINQCKHFVAVINIGKISHFSHCGNFGGLGLHPLVKKKALCGSESVGKGYTEFLFKNKYSVAIGHNRQATTGKVNDRNAHPFGFRIGEGWCFGVHNGIILNKSVIADAYSLEEPEVDSEVVFWAIAKRVNDGMEVADAIVQVTRTIESVASYAFAYLDTANKDIYLWRSEERPMVILDARVLGLGRWFSSTKEIFTEAWQSLRGALGSITKVTYQEARAHRIYRLKESGPLQVVTDIQVAPRIQFPAEPDIDWTIPKEEYEDLSQTDLFAR